MTAISLRDYQVLAKDAAIRVIKECGGFGLFMEQRTGKTLTSLFTMRDLGVKHLLVFCPKRAFTVWDAELKRIPDWNPQVTILNLEQSWRQEKDLLKAKFDGMIIDESHGIKERKSKQSKACWKLAKVIPHRLVLTGTPMESGYEDLYSQFKVINPNHWPLWGEFENRFLIQESVNIPGRPMFKKIIGYKNDHEIEAALLDYTYRITRNQIEKPRALRIKKYYVKLTPESQAHYRGIEKKLITKIKGGEVTTPNILTQALRLHQLCGGFLKDDEGNVHQVGTEKLDKLSELLQDPKYEGVNWVVVARYIAEIDSIIGLGKSLGMDTQEISGRTKFDPSVTPRLTVLQPRSGVAIDLSYANHLVIFSQDYSYLNYSQFKDRVVKLWGRIPTYHFILVRGKMDETIYESVAEKKKLSNVLLSIYSRSTTE